MNSIEPKILHTPALNKNCKVCNNSVLELDKRIVLLGNKEWRHEECHIEFGKDVESVNRTINLHPIAAIANQEIEVRLPLELGPQSYVTNYEARREGDTVVLRVWSANLGVDKE